MAHLKARGSLISLSSLIALRDPRMDVPRELAERWRLEDEEARRIRREKVDWEFIEKQPPKLRLALIHFIEAGDLYKAAKLAELTIDEFNQLRVKAKIPRTT